MTGNSWFLNVLVERIGAALVHFLWEGAAIASALAIVLQVLRSGNPKARYAAAWMALLAMAACLPITAWLVPSKAPTELVPALGCDETALSQLPVITSTNPANRVSSQEKLNTFKQIAHSDELPANAESAAEHQPEPQRLTAGRKLPSFTAMLQGASPWIVGAWFSGAIALAVWHLMGLRHLVRLRRKGTSRAPFEIESVLSRLAERLHVRQSATVLVSRIARSPSVLGWLRPVILLPASIVSEMPIEQMEMIIAHELAHIRRLDNLWNLLQIAIETVLFYHPAMWWVSRQIREERENCCDLEAVAAVGNPRRYAEALVHLAEIRHTCETIATPSSSVAADGGSLESRIRRILGQPIENRCSSGTWLGGVLALLIVATLFLINSTWAAPRNELQKPSPSETAKEAVSTTPPSMSIDAFGKLSDAQRRDVLAAAFQRRVDHEKNLFYEMEQVYRAFENNNGKPGKPTTKYPPYYRYIYRYWRTGDSYKVEQCQYDKPKADDFHYYEATARSAMEGLGRNSSIFMYNGDRHFQNQVVYCDSERDIDEQLHSFPSPDEVTCWTGTQRLFFQYLASHKNRYAIKSPFAGDKVELTVPWTGKQVFVLDPQKDFLPIRFDARTDFPARGGKPQWDETHFEVQESRQVDDVWMPTKMVNKSWGSFGTFIVRETRLLRIESGKVKPADLLIRFAKGKPVVDIIEGVTYTAGAHGEATAPVKDDPSWKHDPPAGWHRGHVPEAESMASVISAADRAMIREGREKKAKPIDEGMAVLRAVPPATQEQQIEAALKILRVYRVFERDGDWSFAIRDLITIGKPAVPKLIDELDRSEDDGRLRAMGFVLRGIGDPCAMPALIRAIPRLIQHSGDCGTTIKNDPELLKFMWMHDTDHLKSTKNAPDLFGQVTFSYHQPITEVMNALQKLTGQSLGWEKLRDASMKSDGLRDLRQQRELFRDHAEKWADWWTINWKQFVSAEADAQLPQTKASLDSFAELIAKMPQVPLPTEIPCGTSVKIGGGLSYHQFEAYVRLGVGPSVPRPSDLLKNSPKDHPSPQLLAWAREKGVNLLRIEIRRPGDSKVYIGYQPVNMKVWKIPNKRLTNLEKELQQSKSLGLPPLWEGPISSVDKQQGDINDEEPATFLFLTADGTSGTIQIRSGLHNDLVEGLPTMGPPVFEFQRIYESAHQ